MKINLTTSNWITIASYCMGLIAFLTIYLVVSGKKMPISVSPKWAVVFIFLIGFAMSLLAGFRDYPDGKFTMPGFLLGILMILGFLAVLILILTIIGVKIPFIPTPKDAFTVIAAIILIKWSLVHLYKVLTFVVKS